MGHGTVTKIMTTAKPKYEIKPLDCVARRHMGAEFHVYDYMVAACKQDHVENGEVIKYNEGDPLVFYGRRWRIANAVNRSETQVDESLRKLEDAGWIISLQGPRGERMQRRTARGRHTTIEYSVLEHREYAMKHENCPEWRYDEETGEPIKPGRMAKAIERKRVTETLLKGGLKADLPNFMLDMVADGIAARKGLPAVQGNPCTVEKDDDKE